MLQQLQEKKKITPILSLGFRPFFLSAGVFSILAMLAWLISFRDGMIPLAPGLSAIQWHAHEMLYGYTMAVIAGFLLTAVRNWTGYPTLEGGSLLTIWLLWLSARIAINFETSLDWAMLSDLAFALMLLVGIARPIIKARQWKQLAVLFKVLLLIMGNGLFYLGQAGKLDSGVQWGLYTGLFIVLAIILTIGRRVIPFFIEKGVAEKVTLRNSKWLDIFSLLLLLILFIQITFTTLASFTSITAFLLFVVHGIRFKFWHTPGIWKVPLLWGLYLGYGFVVVGFGMLALSAAFSEMYFPAIHALAVGGIGMITFSMMSRVSLGHTGRSVHNPPKPVAIGMGFLLLAAFVRVFMPLLFVQMYSSWIIMAQVLWMLAFGCFVIAYSGILLKPDER